MLLCIIVMRKQLELWPLRLIQFTLFYETIVTCLYLALDESSFLQKFHVLEMLYLQSFVTSIQIIIFWLKITYILLSLFYYIAMLATFSLNSDMMVAIIIASVYNIVFAYYLEEQ